MTHEFDYLLSQVNKTVQAASMESLRIGVLEAMRDCFKRIGVEKVCNLVSHDIEIKQGRYRFPEKMVKFIDVIPYNKTFLREDLKSYQLSDDMTSLKHRWEFRKTAIELIFPNIVNATAKIEYWAMYEDDKGEIMIHEDVYSACKEWAEYVMLDASMNVKNPKWQERRIMKQDALEAINAARGELNSSSRASTRTQRRRFNR